MNDHYAEFPNQHEMAIRQETFNRVLNSESPTWKELFDIVAVMQAQIQTNSDFIALYLSRQDNQNADYNTLHKNYLEKMDISMVGLIESCKQKFISHLQDSITK